MQEVPRDKEVRSYLNSSQARQEYLAIKRPLFK